MINKLFGKKTKKSGKEDDKELTIEDLVTLERYDEAEAKLKERVKYSPKDLHAHLKLAEVYVALKNVTKALDEYLFVADSHVDDGFFDKGIAILGKAAKLAPGDDTLPRRIEKYKRLKRLEARRKLAIVGLLSNKTTVSSSAANAKLQMELLWNKIAKSHLVEKLTGEKLQKLFSVMEMVQTKAGDVLVEEGDRTPAIYLIVDGTVEAMATISGTEMNIRSFTTGDLIGEGALLEHKAWPARYVVSQSGMLFKLDRAGLEQTMVGNDDPRGYISVLRQQNNDRDVLASLQRLGR